MANPPLLAAYATVSYSLPVTLLNADSIEDGAVIIEREVCLMPCCLARDANLARELILTML